MPPILPAHTKSTQPVWPCMPSVLYKRSLPHTADMNVCPCDSFFRWGRLLFTCVFVLFCFIINRIMSKVHVHSASRGDSPTPRPNQRALLFRAVIRRSRGREHVRAASAGQARYQPSSLAGSSQLSWDVTTKLRIARYKTLFRVLTYRVYMRMFNPEAYLSPFKFEV